MLKTSVLMLMRWKREEENISIKYKKSSFLFLYFRHPHQLYFWDKKKRNHPILSSSQLSSPDIIPWWSSEQQMGGTFSLHTWNHFRNKRVMKHNMSRRWWWGAYFWGRMVQISIIPFDVFLFVWISLSLSLFLSFYRLFRFWCSSWHYVTWSMARISVLSFWELLLFSLSLPLERNLYDQSMIFVERDDMAHPTWVAPLPFMIVMIMTGNQKGTKMFCSQCWKVLKRFSFSDLFSSLFWTIIGFMMSEHELFFFIIYGQKTLSDPKLQLCYCWNQRWWASSKWHP